MVFVTGGVVVTTFSASKPKPGEAGQPDTTSANSHMKAYATGIGILSLALLLSGFLGMIQDKTYATYTRNIALKAGEGRREDCMRPPAWQESMFYIHLLSMPMFYFLRDDLASQFAALRASPTTRLVIPSPPRIIATFARDKSSTPNSAHALLHEYTTPFWLPSGYIPLVLNTLTQVICVSGVHRLTSRVSSLTVTLVLVVRKAVSLLISVLLFGSKGTEPEERVMMWLGAAMVFMGTVFYSMASREQKIKRE